MLKIEYNLYRQFSIFQERKYTSREIDSYINHVLSTPFNERGKLETNRGEWKFSHKKMEEWCKENGISFVDSHEFMGYVFLSRNTEKSEKALSVLRKLSYNPNQYVR